VDIASVAQIGLPSQFSSATPALQAGQIIDALVLALLDGDMVRLALPSLVLDVRSAVPLTAGTTVRLAVQSTPSGIQLVIVPDSHGTAPDVVQAPRGLPAEQSPAVARQGTATISSSDEAAIVEIAGTRVASAAPTAEPADVTTAQVLGQATRIAAARQGGLAPLLANVLALVNATPASTPKPVLEAALNLLGRALPLDESLSGADIKTAMAQSGLFLEAQLAPADNQAPGAKPGAQAPSNLPGTAAAAPVNDLKATLLVFREVVKLWLDAAAPPAPPPSSGSPAPAKLPTLPNPPAPPQPAAPAAPPPAASQPEHAVLERAAPAPPPPYRGAPPVAQPAVAASIPASAAPAETAQRLLGQADAALARHTLLQVASLGETHSPGPRTESQGPQWLFEIPFATRQGMSVAQFAISRDGRGNGTDARTIWRARFSLDIEPMGPVHAQVSLLGERATVTLWAERAGSAMRLAEHTALLSEALREAELEPGDIQCRTGAPAAPPRAAAAGRFLDQAS
jgi:hypothetical protein